MNMYSTVTLTELIDSSLLFSLSIPVGASYEQAEQVVKLFSDKLNEMKEAALKNNAEKEAQPE